jgi:hypothetical protein
LPKAQAAAERRDKGHSALFAAGLARRFVPSNVVILSEAKNLVVGVSAARRTARFPSALLRAGFGPEGRASAVTDAAG